MTTTMVPERETTTEREVPIEVTVLERAALILEEFGRCTHRLYSTDKPLDEDETADKIKVDDSHWTSYCALGAIWRAGYEHGLLPPTFEGLEALADNRFDGEAYNVIGECAGLSSNQTWEVHRHNDRLETTTADSVRHLRELAQERKEPL